jgi:hypothetical protein
LSPRRRRRFGNKYIYLKMLEVTRFEHTPHPIESDLYFKGRFAPGSPVNDE